MPRQPKQSRELIRMAVQLYERLTESRKAVPLLLPETQWLECERLGRLLAKAIQRGWLAAAKQIRPRLEQSLRELQMGLTQVLSGQNQQPAVPLSLRELHAEFVGLYDEFPNT
ncbi:MAG: hypothetical protein KDA84_20925, partial [Planctomycetaceae bacterium]|nr:hypothetical protein [Planctomycetaceae bacterium]